MGIIEALVKQSGKPSGLIGRIMVRTMKYMDSGLNKWIVDQINVPKGTALDIGCGGGEAIYSLLKNNRIKDIIGIDYSMDSVNISKKRNSTFIEMQRADIIQGNVTELPFSDDIFDVILTVRSHYFWDNFEKAFSEIYRTLKRGGKMLIFSERYKIKYHLKQYNTDESMTYFLQSMGFINILVVNKGNTQCITCEK